MATSGNKTGPTGANVSLFLDAVGHPTRRADAHALDALFREVTGWAPRMWGPTIVGYGSYAYRYESGREGEFLATGFSPRKASLVLYIMPGYAGYGDLLAGLGKHKFGKSCLYINKLSDVDEGALRRLIRAGLDDLAAKYPVSPS
ncbi:DUF1801 domain-containing protein [Sinisalibacter aestuarii]|uniref:YdhG-like domain-containing protein n=1 Tax=Sinisalibacter aestuarii TaxID=2949426 RepID=A0ABQ5LVK9_9RHOB|nr:DUF1801 domain-containing protein [Sinisalibacter aestuarii]GKY88401.1 hypothetical protein STA1M1_22700 [Sinisalibacter aestuarii]